GGHSIYLATVTIAAWSTLHAVGARLSLGGALPWVFAGASTALMLLATALALFTARVDVAQGFLRILSIVPSSWLRARLSRCHRAVRATDANLARLVSAPATSLVRAALPYVASWFCEALESFVILRLLGVHLAFFDVAVLDAGVSLVRSLAFVAPSGLGV